MQAINVHHRGRRRDSKHTKSARTCGGVVEVIDLTGNQDERSIFLTNRIGGEEIEDLITCPITLTVMEDPVIIEDGHTYERSAILEHFRRQGFESPLTRQKVKKSSMVVNRFAKNIIQMYLLEKKKFVMTKVRN